MKLERFCNTGVLFSASYIGECAHFTTCHHTITNAERKDHQDLEHEVTALLFFEF